MVRGSARTRCSVEISVCAQNQSRVWVLAVCAVLGTKAVKCSQITLGSNSEHRAGVVCPAAVGSAVKIPVGTLHEPPHGERRSGCAKGQKCRQCLCGRNDRRCNPD